MFETYTEAARKTIFIGRFEAGQFGSKLVEVEHIFLGLLRADLPLAIRLFETTSKVDELRDRVEHGLIREKSISPSTNLPFSDQSRLVLDYAAEESRRLNHQQVTSEHLLIGILREQESLAARVMLESGFSFSGLRGKIEHRPGRALTVQRSEREDSPDLVEEASNGVLRPLIGRENELAQVMQILLRRTKNSVVLIGEAGVGKDSMVRGLAQRIALGDVPAGLVDRKIFQVDAGEFAASFSSEQGLSQFTEWGGPILYVRGLIDRRVDMPGLAHFLKQGKLQIITTGAPLSWRLALDRDDDFVRNFEAVNVQPATEEEAVEILASSKEEFEKFHGVAISPEAIEMAVTASGRFVRHRPLPDRAIDLLDEAGVRVKLQRDLGPPEIVEMERRWRVLARQQQYAVANLDLEKAANLSVEERDVRQKLAQLREKAQPEKQALAVTAADVIEVIAARTSLTVAAVNSVLEQPPQAEEREEIKREFASRIPVGKRDWIDGLLAYLADCSVDEADSLLQGIRTAKKKLERTS